MMRRLDQILSTPTGRWFIRLLRIGLGGLFIYASLDKIWYPAAFAEAIYNYRLFPSALLHVAAILLPWLEIVTGTLLVFNVFPRSSVSIIGGLLLVFTVAILIAISRGLDISCGCFDLDHETRNLNLGKVLENLGMIFAAVLVWWRANPEPASIETND